MTQADDSILEKFYDANELERIAYSKARLKAKTTRLLLDNVTEESSKGDGSVIEEHPVVLVITDRSFRIVDSMTGETLSKYMPQQIVWTVRDFNRRGGGRESTGGAAVTAGVLLLPPPSP